MAEEENRMADNPKDRQPQDAQRVNIDQNYELQYWSQKFGVSPEQLKRVVARVGPMADNVERAITESKSTVSKVVPRAAARSAASAWASHARSSHSEATGKDARNLAKATLPRAGSWACGPEALDASVAVPGAQWRRNVRRPQTVTTAVKRGPRNDKKAGEIKMRKRRSLTDRTKVAIEQWIPFDGRQFALLVLFVFGTTAVDMFARW